MDGADETGMTAGLQDNNVTTGNDTYPESLPGEMPPLGAEAWVVPVLFALIGVVGVGANALVIYVSNKFNELKTATNRYIVGLAVVDLAFLFVCAPFTASLFATTSWALGKSMCKFIFYFMQVTVQAMCVTRCALTLDRYFAVVHPISSINYRSPRFAVTVCALIWIVALLMSAPLAANLDLHQTEWHGTQTYCMERWDSHAGQITYWITVVLLTYVLPLAIGIRSCIAVVEKLWGRNAVDPNIGPQIRNRILIKRRKVCLMVITMVVIFAICWLPTQVLLLWQVIAKEDFPFTLVTFSWKIAALILTYLQSAISPIVYIAFGHTFRRKLKQAFLRMFRSSHENQVARRAAARQAGGGQAAAVRIAGARRGNNVVLPYTTRQNTDEEESEDVFGGVWNRKRNPVPVGAFNVSGTPRCADIGNRQVAPRQLIPRAPTVTNED
ncbi:G-protein coupled receptor 54-like isoform X2 [Branchiostoma floridae x Branchiostoma japonicum]